MIWMRMLGVEAMKFTRKRQKKENAKKRTGAQSAPTNFGVFSVFAFSREPIEATVCSGQAE
jgi:hypothetical protein